MSLEKILNKIVDEAREEADKIVLASRERAEQIKQTARKEASKLADALLKEAERQGNLEASRIVTQARLQKRLNILSCKKRLIDEVLDRAFQQESLRARTLKRKVILKEGEKEESFDEKRLRDDLRQSLEKYIAEVLRV